MEDIFFTLGQVAEKLQVTEKTIQRWLQAGKLKGYKLERMWRVTESDLQEFLQTRKNTPSNTN